MEQAVVVLANTVVPGAGAVLVTLNLLRRLAIGMKESRALCESLHARLDATWTRLLKLEKESALPPKFKVADFTAILARFHALVLKQANKKLVVRVGTSISFMHNLQALHEDLDELNDSFRDQAAETLLQWRVQWERDVVTMKTHIAQLAADGVAARMVSASQADSNEALATLVHEQKKVLDHDQILDALQAICFQLARQRKLALPSSMPPWFFTFDDVDVESKPLHAIKSNAMGTVHRAKWGAQTNVIVKKIELPTPPTTSSEVAWKEADVWWKLNHPNVVRMFGACHVTKPAFIVCEEAKHGNIREYLSADQRHWRLFWRLQLDVAVGLAHLKANRVIHGNLKVSNILVGDDSRAKITDFGFSSIHDHESFDENDTLLTEGSDDAAVSPMVENWSVPDVRQRGDPTIPSYENDVYAFAVCMMELLSGKELVGKHQLFARLTQRPRDISDGAWNLIKRMSSQDPKKRPTIHLVVRCLERLAEEELAKHECYSSDSVDSLGESHDVDYYRSQYQQHKSARPGAGDDDVRPQDHLKRELENLRQKIRDEERALERLMEKRQREETARANARTQQAGENSGATPLPSSLTTKQLLRIVRWGTTDEQTQALTTIDANRVEHSAHDIIRHNGLETIVACMKYGHSSEFRQVAIDILQSVATSGTGVYMEAVLDNSVPQVLMGILHYRRVAHEQRRAGQLLVLLSTKSSRARSFFLQQAGLELLIKLLWQEHLPLFDKRFREITDPAIVDDMRSFLASHGEARTRDGDRAMSQRGNHDLALQKYTEAIVLDPQNGRLYAKRSAVYAAFRRFDHAAKDAEQCIRRLPNYGEGYFRHALALFQLKKVEQADRAIRHGRKYDPQYFTQERMFELSIHAPRGRDQDNPKMWAAAGSVEL